MGVQRDDVESASARNGLVVGVRWDGRSFHVGVVGRRVRLDRSVRDGSGVSVRSGQEGAVVAWVSSRVRVRIGYGHPEHVGAMPIKA